MKTSGTVFRSFAFLVVVLRFGIGSEAQSQAEQGTLLRNEKAAIPPIVISGEASNLRVMVSSFTEGTNASVADLITYGFLANTNEPETILVPKSLAYLCFADLLNEQGKPVPKSKTGKAIGQQFFNISPDPKKVDWRLTRTLGTQSLPPPATLFEIDKPGKYVLRLQFQLFHKISKTKPAVLVRFPPVDYLVYKEATVPERQP